MGKIEAGQKVLLFYNPHAGNGLLKNNLDFIVERFQAKRLIVIPVRAGKADVLERIFKNLDQKEYRQVIAAGGDGTVNICINAMIRCDIDLPLAIFPSGTANDFAYYLDLPQEIDKMIDVALGDCYTYSDVGKANDKYFINVSAMGMLVDVSQKTDPNLKNILGVMSYYIRGLQEVPNLRPIPVKISSEEFSGELKIYFMLVMNGRSAGGFKKISPSAEINDGYLDVLIFKEMPILEFGPLLIQLLQGQHEEGKNVISFRTKDMKVESSVAVSTDVDGEKGSDFPLHIEILPRRLRICTQSHDMEGAIW